MAARAGYSDSNAPTLISIGRITIIVVSFEVWTLIGISPTSFGACEAARACYADSNAPTLNKIRWISSVVVVI